MPEVEKELSKMGKELLRGKLTLEQKFELNQKFTNLLVETLKRPESYYFGFDSVTTLSRLSPADNSFRIFSWTFTDRDSNNTVFDHYYGGVVQRWWQPDRSKPATIVVIPLRQSRDISLQLESDILPAESWPGALYYKPRYYEAGVLANKGKYLSIDGLSGKTKFIKTTYYTILGFNGSGIGSNYKVVDVIGFDRQDSSKVYFGAPIFHFGAKVKARAVFRYAENAPFSLNLGYIIRGSFFKRKQLALVFDHLAQPNKSKPQQSMQIGPDGTYDALMFLKRADELRKGGYYHFRNVVVYSPEVEKYDPKELRKQAERERMRLYQQGIRPK